MIKPDNLQALSRGLPLNADQLFRVDVITILRPVSPCVAASHHLLYHAVLARELPQQHSAALKRLGLLAMTAKLLVIGVFDGQHVVYFCFYLAAPAIHFVPKNQNPLDLSEWVDVGNSLKNLVSFATPRRNGHACRNNNSSKFRSGGWQTSTAV